MFIVSGAATAYMYLRPHGRTVEIESGGRILYTIDLDREKDREIVIEYEGRKNTVVISSGDICVREADCPDHVCIRTGWLSKAGGPIVCLPNRLVIRYKEGGGLDAAAG
ncbi:MAG: NusG domain II-containing protein [Ruminococcus sp.]|nr:NusG domain II-containing protein [Ruminococcus sp.]